ncbi:hypothetical protein OAI59_03080 [Flavobacteriaceae bacterium]|nr:hypothetical protein [Flavobacteriaceae bacterium]
MIKRLLYISLLLFFSCTKVDLQTPESVDSQPDVTFYQLNLIAGPSGYAGSNGWVSLHLTKPSEYFKYQRVQDRAGISPLLPSGIEITISASPAEGYYFDKWSNGWTDNPKTFKINSDIDATAVFKTIGD